MNARKEFTKFLKEHDAYEKFHANCRNERTTIKKLEKTYFTGALCKIDKPMLFIIAAFDWQDSPEGFTFWSTLDDLWCLTL